MERNGHIIGAWLACRNALTTLALSLRLSHRTTAALKYDSLFRPLWPTEAIRRSQHCGGSFEAVQHAFKGKVSDTIVCKNHDGVAKSNTLVGSYDDGFVLTS